MASGLPNPLERVRVMVMGSGSKVGRLESEGAIVFISPSNGVNFIWVVGYGNGSYSILDRRC